MGNHWYSSKDGSPVYEVKKSKGEGKRPTNLADARKLKLVPSVTTILDTISKPMLERWKQNQIINAVLEHPFDLAKHSIDGWKKTILEMSQKEGRDAAERGSIIHDALEQFYLGKRIPKDLMPYTNPAIEIITKEFENDMHWIPEASFSHSLGYGGKCDLHRKEIYPVVIDFKTKNTDDISKVKPYTEHCMQLAAYREGFDIPTAVCYNLYISTKKPNEIKLYKWPEKELQRGWQMFKSLLYYWQLDNNFGDPHAAKD